ncbi:phospholipase D-like domain-containing protein DpdK [uncultured Acinetobacter sp.]|uniref:phospholipase D-like domain-containing protein DpdK n=1 Tax=uncultured Acinetobacter sp. TaxID=165433 RepID=UPI002603027D|nr:phospholipase D-like domain-containing protein DpdK [uncultured Acinetobacter sp.]
MSRKIYLNQSLGRRQFKEVFTTLLLGTLFNKDELWIVSPWVTDFELIDNTANQWNALVPQFEPRYIRFSEVLIMLVQAGVALKMVIRRDPINSPFLAALYYQLGKHEGLSICCVDKLHTKGVISKDGLIEGSLNLTYSGVESNDEVVTLNTDPKNISESLLEFKKYTQWEKIQDVVLSKMGE